MVDVSDASGGPNLLATFAHGPLGLQLSRRPQRLEALGVVWKNSSAEDATIVIEVQDGSQAKEQGIREGATLLEVNHASIAGVDNAEVFAMIRSTGRPLTLLVTKPSAIDTAIAKALATDKANSQSRDAAEEALKGVLAALQRVGPILTSFIDENCMLFLPGIGSEEGAYDLFEQYNTAVDTLVLSLLSDKGLHLDVAARAIILAREHSEDVSLVAHLLALESFDLFQDLMCRRNEEMHKAARAQMGQPADAQLASPPTKRQLRFKVPAAAAAKKETGFAKALREARQREREEQDEVETALGSHHEGAKEGPGRCGARSHRASKAGEDGGAELSRLRL